MKTSTYYGLIFLLVGHGSTSLAQVTPNAGPTVFSTNQALTFYVDATNGNDANVQTACSTPTTGACKTIQAALNIVPKHIRNPVTINVAAGTYSAGAYVSGFSFDVGDQPVNTTNGPYLRIVGTPSLATLTTGPNTGTFTSGTLGGKGYGVSNPSFANWGTATLTAAGWTSNNLAGLLVKITSGTGAGQVVRIQGNTSTVITIDGVWPSGIAPDSTSVFQILTSTGGTIINGVLPRPPGATGYAYSAASGAAFFIHDNSASGFVASAVSGGGATWGGGIADAMISLDYLDFELTSSQVAVGLSGKQQYVGVRFSTVTAGIGMRSAGSDTWFESNYCTPSGTLQGCVYTTGYPDAAPDGAFARIQGNYATGSGYLAILGNAAIVAQNYVATSNGGIELLATAHVFSYGNDYATTGTAMNVNLTWGGSSTEVTAAGIESDGDTCTGTGTCVRLLGSATFETTGDALTGTSTTGVSIAGRSLVRFNAADSLTSTNDLSLDGTNYTLTTLTNVGGALQSMSGGLIRNSTVTAVARVGSFAIGVNGTPDTQKSYIAVYWAPGAIGGGANATQAFTTGTTGICGATPASPCICGSGSGAPCPATAVGGNGTTGTQTTDDCDIGGPNTTGANNLQVEQMCDVTAAGTITFGMGNASGASHTPTTGLYTCGCHSHF